MTESKINPTGQVIVNCFAKIFLINQEILKWDTMNQVLFRNTRRLLVVLILAISGFNVKGYGLPLPRIILTEPIGSRSSGMGGTGYALADDETALFFNPAGLGIRNERWESGALTASTKHVSMNGTPKLWGFVFQEPTISKLGFSVYWEQIDNIYAEYYKEYSLSAGAGFTFFSNTFISNSAGLALKWYHESIETDMFVTRDESDSYSNVFAVDLGYILEIANQFRIGLSLKNISSDYHLKRDGENVKLSALPFQTAVSLGYKKSFSSSLNKLRVLDLASEITYKTKHSETPLSERTGDRNYWKSSYLQTGVDFCFLKSISTRFGYVKHFNYTYEDEREFKYDWHALSWGIGLSLFNHFDFDFFRQKEFVSGYSVNQGFSTSYKRAFKWSRSDRKWWFDK